MKRRQVLATLAAAAAVGPAAAQSGTRSYAVVSEIAREVFVTTFQESTGTRLGANLTPRLPIADGALEKVSLVAARSAITAADQGAPIWLIAPLETDLFDARAAYVEGTKVKLPDDLAAEMKQRGTTHLFIFSRLRDEANLRARNARLGTGQIEGLGFYIDPHAMMTNSDTLVTTKGFIAPYLYARATLVDARTGTILRMRRIVEGQVIAAERAEQGSDPWNVMTPADKVRLLSTLIQRQVGEAVPALLAGV